MVMRETARKSTVVLVERPNETGLPRIASNVPRTSWEVPARRSGDDAAPLRALQHESLARRWAVRPPWPDRWRGIPRSGGPRAARHGGNGERCEKSAEDEAANPHTSLRNQTTDSAAPARITRNAASVKIAVTSWNFFE